MSRGSKRSTPGYRPTTEVRPGFSGECPEEWGARRRGVRRHQVKGLNFKRLLDDVLSRKASKIYVTYEDRLARFGFDLLSWVCGRYEKEIVVVNSKDASSPKEELVQDLNFKSVDSTKASLSSSQPSLTSVDTRSLKEIVRIQNDFSRRRRALQRHVKNPQKRAKKLRETRGRQRNRIKDALHKLSTKTVRENPDASFVFEDLRGIRKTSNGI
jgi:transposase